MSTHLQHDRGGWRWLAALIAVLAIALAQTTSLWNFTGEHVDEKALYLYAVGFFGGDLDPHWYGYGSLGMYLLWLWYLLLALPGLLGGIWSSLDDYALRVFTDPFFVVAGRYLFAVLGAAAVLLHARTARLAGVPSGLILLFLAIALSSRDALWLANLMRTDTLVGLFGVALALHAAVQIRSRGAVYLLAVAIAAAIASKISALPLTLFLLAFLVLRARDGTLQPREWLAVSAAFLASLWLFQPYMNWSDELRQLFAFALDTGNPQEWGQWGAPALDSLAARWLAIQAILVRYVGLPVLLCLPLLVFAWPERRTVLPALLLLALLILPYLTASEIDDYWFAPVFNLLRLLALLGIAGAVRALVSWLEPRAPRLAVWSGPALILGLLALAGGTLLIQAGQEYRWRHRPLPPTNAGLAQIWLEQHLLEQANLAIEPNYRHVLPVVYDRSQLETSMRLSGCFAHNRQKNAYLVELFAAYLDQRYPFTARGVRLATDIPDDWDEYFYVTSPYIYERFLSRSDAGLSPAARSELALHQARMRAHRTAPPWRVFADGRGPAVEIYRIR